MCYNRRMGEKKPSRIQQAFSLFDQGVLPDDPKIKVLRLKINTARRYYRYWKAPKVASFEEAPENTGDSSEKATGMGKTATATVQRGKFNAPPAQATSLELIPQVHRMPMTADIWLCFQCAVINGFPGGLSEFISLAVVDFWLGRGRNPYEEVSRYGYGAEYGVGQNDGGENDAERG